MTTVDVEETVQWCDPRWQQVGITYYTLNYWTSRRYLRPDKANPGSGVNRRWPVGEVEVAARMVRVVKAGFRPAQAAVIARASGPVEVGPGVWVGVADLEEEAAPVACELCHEHPPVGVRDGLRLCVDCARYADYYASLTPDEWRAEQKAMDAYVAETRGQ